MPGSDGVPTRVGVYGGVVTTSAELDIPEDGGVSYLDMDPPGRGNKCQETDLVRLTDLSSEKGLKVPATVMLGRNLVCSTLSSTPASSRTVLRPARLGWETNRYG